MIELDNVIEEIVKAEADYSVVMNFQGAFHQDLINRILEQIRERILSTADSKKIVSKVYGILYELMNNILLHAHPIDNEESFGFILLLKNSSSYKIVSGNFLPKNTFATMESSIQIINAMTADLLNDEHTKRMKQGLQEGKVGEGLGFVQLRKLADAPLMARLFNFSEQLSIYTVSCTVSRA